MSLNNLTPAKGQEISLADALARTPARLMVGRAGSALRTVTTLTLRADHAVARDAVHSEINSAEVFGEGRIRRYGMLELSTSATTRMEYLKRPDLGRRLDNVSRNLLISQDIRGDDVRIAIGDGLSAAAVVANASALLDVLMDAISNRGYRLGPPLFIRNCRVGLMNELGDLLMPKVVVLLIGERPGLATSESLSAYLAYCPQSGQTDAHRNLVSNIHRQGLSIPEASSRIDHLVSAMMSLQTSGIALTSGGRIEVADLPEGR